MVALVARQIDDGAVANLGIGMRKRVATHLSAGKEVMLHSENVVIGEGPAAAAVEEDHNLIGAGKQPVTLLPGGVFLHHAESFAMMRGWHWDVCAGRTPGASEGAVDLATGARKTWIRMGHNTMAGEPTLVTACSNPVTGLACVSRVHTELAVLDITPQRARVRELAEGLDFATLQARTGTPLMLSA